MYYGRTDRNCECPYKAVLEVNDRTGNVWVVLWNSVCVSWYRCLKPGDIISLRRYRVKQHYQAELNDIEISVNSRNPAAQISVLQESTVSPDYLPPAPTYSFYNRYMILFAHEDSTQTLRAVFPKLFEPRMRHVIERLWHVGPVGGLVEHFEPRY
ncbi:RPA-related protein RADX-like [Astatotilapia calliptera]|uniref:RPA-related protein RADX-like n=1 Tax=Astatotilapia calliptera TaxID=8154 RepID=UPI000E411F69|nr:RPA-related protein RADX-like [Astatotilapia calliptera]